MAKKKPASRAEKNWKPGNRRNLEIDKPSDSRGYMSGKDVTWTGEDAHDHISKYLKDMGLIEAILVRVLEEQNTLALGMCFPFAIQKAGEWWDRYYTPPDDPDDPGVKHPDLNDLNKFKVVHGTVTDKWKKPAKPVVHAWVEMGDTVFDDQTKVTKPDGVHKDFYYEMYQPEVFAEYTAEQALNKCAMSGYEGPWDEDLAGAMRARDAWLNDGLIRENVDISINGIPLNVELAKNNAERAQGLMYRSHLPKESGMLFAFPDQDDRSFWMRNTHVPLSIAYADAKGKIINIEDMEPYSEVGVRSKSPATYALEMNKGWFDQNGIKPGNSLDGVVGLQCESLLTDLIIENTRILNEELTEKELLRDVLRAALDAGAIVLSGGLGGDTVVDIVFAVQGSAEVLSAVDDAINSASDISQAMQGAMATNISSGADAIYQAVEAVIVSIANAGDFAEDIIGQMAETISDLLNKLISSVSDWVATALPDDAGLGGIIFREAMEEVVAQLSTEVYELLKSGFNKLPQEAQTFIADPAAFEAFLNEIADKIIAYIDGEDEKSAGGEEKEEKSDAGEMGGEMFDTLGDVAGTVADSAPDMGSIIPNPVLGKVRDFLDNDFRAMIPTATQILNKLVTAFFGAVALAQILARWNEGQYPEGYEPGGQGQEQGQENKEEEGGLLASIGGAITGEALLRAHIRFLIKEELL